MDLQIAIHGFLADASGLHTSRIDPSDQVRDGGLEAVGDRCEVALVLGDQLPAGLVGEVVGKGEDTGRQWVHRVGSDLATTGDSGPDSATGALSQAPRCAISWRWKGADSVPSAFPPGSVLLAVRPPCAPSSTDRPNVPRSRSDRRHVALRTAADVDSRCLRLAGAGHVDSRHGGEQDRHLPHPSASADWNRLQGVGVRTPQPEPPSIEVARADRPADCGWVQRRPSVPAATLCGGLHP